MVFTSGCHCSYNNDQAQQHAYFHCNTTTKHPSGSIKRVDSLMMHGLSFV